MLREASDIETVGEAFGGLDQPPLFVYGSLRHGLENYGILRSHTVSEIPATLRGTQLYSLGWFPMLVEAPPECAPAEGVVTGELMILRPQAYSRILAALDHLEGYDEDNPDGSFYRRVRRTVIAQSGRMVTAWVYLGTLAAIAAYEGELVTHGDWVRFRKERLLSLRGESPRTSS